MNEMLAEYGMKALQWLESSAAWISGEIPVYIEEIIKWNMAKNIVFVSVYFVIAMAFITGFVVIIKKGIKEYDWDECEILPTSLIFVASQLTWIGVIHHILNIIQISVAPRVFLIEYLSSIVQ